MATIRRLGLPIRHFQSEPNRHVQVYRRGKLKRSGRGLSFWFAPFWSSITEQPCDDQDLPFIFHGRSSDFQDITLQGALTYRISRPDDLAQRIDFSLDLIEGAYVQTPLEQLADLLTQMAQQLVGDYLNETPLRQLLSEGVDEVRKKIGKGMSSDPNLKELGLDVISVRVAEISPTPDLEKALQAPVREAIQQESDEAVFQRRALAVEKERAIAENELQNRIELARREQELIEQEGQNKRQDQFEQAAVQKIAAESKAFRDNLQSETRATGIRLVEGARVDSEKDRMAIYEKAPIPVLYGMAARELAGKLERIDHLNLGDASLAPLLGSFLQTGIRNLEANE